MQDNGNIEAYIWQVYELKKKLSALGQCVKYSTIV